ncbi:MAG TPA: T9SS type A sorting domain-containing protein, partial [Ignavibacteriaceae bacterium]|nr:T9SS type A sorting domain-containing protein [Ignavibacteriaceae bacterium]
SIVAGSTNKIIDSVSSNGTFNPADFFSTNSNVSLGTTAEAQLTSPFDLNNPNFLPLAGSPALSGAGTPPDDGFFDPSGNYIGAFNTEDWTFGWARFNPDSTTITGIKERNKNIQPAEYTLSQNYPNPFNPSTKIQYSVSNPGFIKLTVYNILGQQVETLVNGFKNAGTYEITWNASNLSSGIYFYRIEAGNFVSVKKMTLLK